MRIHHAVGGFVLALAGFFGIGALWIESQPGYAGISTRTVPLVVAVGLFLCGLTLLLRPGSVLGAAARAVPQPAAQAETQGAQSLGNNNDGERATAQYRRLAWLVAGLLLNMALIGLIGFPLASVLLMVCVARGYGSLRPWRDGLIALALTIPLWLLFTRVLAIGLPLLPLFGI
jgi:putative tricarboxylic transport membrane protein